MPGIHQPLYSYDERAVALPVQQRQGKVDVLVPCSGSDFCFDDHLSVYFEPEPLMPQFHGISASIICNKTDLLEYQAEFDEDTKTATCWIPSEARKNYSVRWTQEENLAPGGSITGRVYLDGSDEMVASAVSVSESGCRVERHGKCISQTEERPFMFVDVTLTGAIIHIPYSVPRS